jgi:hypothetical protein
MWYFKVKSISFNVNLVKDEKGDMLADYHNILNSYENYFSQLWNLRTVGNVRQMEMYLVKPLLPELSPSEVEIVMVKW